LWLDCLNCIMIDVFVMSVVDHEIWCFCQSVVDHVIEPWSGQTQDYKIGICCFSDKHVYIGVRSKTGWSGVEKMCPSGATCQPKDCSFNGPVL